MPPAPEPALALAQARARWGDEVVVAGLFRPGPDPRSRTSLTRALSRRSNRRQAQLPPRLLVAVGEDGQAYMCAQVADSQGGHPEGDDLYAGPFEELGAVTAGELCMVVLLDDDRVAVLEAAWLDRDAASVTALLTGEALPDELAREAEPPDDDRDEDDGEPSPAELLAEAAAFQARADSLRALAAVREEQEAEKPARPPKARRPSR